MKKTITTLKDILMPLCKEQESVRQNLSSPALETYQTVSEILHPITVPDIKNLFKLSCPSSETCKANSSQWGKVLYLPPLEQYDHFVPILSLKCELKETESIAQFRVMLICLKNNKTIDEFYGLGFRMETPGSNVNDGIHDFYHAQLVRKLDSKLKNKLQITCPNWIPDSQPSFPLPADCPVTLLFCLIVTLYGKTYCRQFLEEHKSSISYIKSYQKKLNKWIDRK